MPRAAQSFPSASLLFSRLAESFLTRVILIVPIAYTYDAENHLTSTAGVTYTYDGRGFGVCTCKARIENGKRVMKSSGKIYWYGMGSDPLDETDSAGNTNNSSFFEYVFFNGQRIARRDYQNNVNYYFADHLGTARVVANSSGVLLDDSDFYPFGGERASCEPNGAPGCTYPPGSGNAYKFTSKERDSESGLDNFGARYDSSSLGRFMGPDSGVDQHPEAPQSWNLYSYALNNPLNLVDPTGEYVCGAGITQTMCDNFQKSLDAAQADANKLKETYGADSTEYKDAQRAIDFYGKENIDNGVTLTLGGQPKGADGQVDPNVGSTTPTSDNPLGQKITVHFAESAFSGSADNAILIGHEGSHGADASDWVKSGFSPGKNPNLYNSEWRALHLSASLAAISGYGPYGFFSGPSEKKVYIWEPAWARQAGWGRRVDAAIDSLLRDKNGTYGGLDPRDKLGAFRRNTKGNQ